MLKFGSRGDNNIVYKCTVRLLEDTEILECEYKPHHKGKYLLDHVCQQLNLVEQDYLGLRYVDINDQRHWLDLGKSIVKQVKDLDPVLFSFRVKFYPPDPFKVKEEITRYQIFLQVKRDLLHGRLYCVPNEAAQLAAYIVQWELGDYDPDIHYGNYVSDLRILIKQTEAIEEKAMDIHQRQLKGQTPEQMENMFMKLAAQLDTYGIDPHSVKDHKSAQMYLGINYSGILTIQGSKKTHHFRWLDIQKINYEGKMFIIHLNYNDKKHTVGFKCPTGAACRHVWRCAMEQMLFFTLNKSSDAPVVSGGGFFSWGTKFKYTGRTEREIREDTNSLDRDEPNIQRTASMRRKASSVPATPSTPLQPHLGYNNFARSSHSDAGGSRMEPCTSAGLCSTLDGGQIYADVAGLETVCEDQEGAGMTKLRTTVLKDDSTDRFSDYYFRDSFEHSSSESQLNLASFGRSSVYEPTTARSSRSQTPLLSHMSAVDGRACVANNHGAAKARPEATPRGGRRFNVAKAFVPSFVIVTTLVLASTIVLMESESDALTGLRAMPEINSLRYQVYEPLKQYIRQIWARIFS